jgi:2-dehydropantoate 2-reductase
VTTVAVIGAGSVGAVAAASAVDAGHEVLLCVRTGFDHLVVRRDGDDRVVKARAVTSPAELVGPADVVLLAVKVQDTPSTVPWLTVLCGPSTVIGVLQNGLDPTPRLRSLLTSAVSGSAAADRAVGAEVPVVATVAYLAAERTGPGRVTFHAADRVAVRAGPGAETLVGALGTWLPVSVVDAAGYRQEMWRKLIGNAVANTITALTLRRVSVLADPAAADLVRALVTEGVAVAVADGASFGPDEAEDMAGYFIEEWATRTSGSSMYYDRVAGRPLEHEALTGALVEVAARHGVAVPHHETVLALLRLLDPGAERGVLAGGASSR